MRKVCHPYNGLGNAGVTLTATYVETMTSLTATVCLLHTEIIFSNQHTFSTAYNLQLVSIIIVITEVSLDSTDSTPKTVQDVLDRHDSSCEQ